jgi:hypothetical protein
MMMMARHQLPVSCSWIEIYCDQMLAERDVKLSEWTKPGRESADQINRCIFQQHQKKKLTTTERCFLALQRAVCRASKNSNNIENEDSRRSREETALQFRNAHGRARSSRSQHPDA